MNTMSPLLKPVCLSCDVYRGRASIMRSYAPFQPRLIQQVDQSSFGMTICDSPTLYVAFRGCKNLDEVLYCIQTEMKKPFANRRMLINRAIWNKYEEIKEELDGLTKDILDNYDINKIVYTGHSLGGSVAQVSALLLNDDVAKRDIITSCVSFGSPHVGDEEYARECANKIKGDNKRVVIRQDIIPKIKFNNAQVHAGTEKLIESSCSSLFPASIYDHHTSVNYLRCVLNLEDDYLGDP